MEDKPVLLLLGNHASHVGIDVINFCKANHITLLSFTPHCSHELQPLDKTVYGPFKTLFNQAADKWMKDPLKAGLPMTIHILPKLIKYNAFEKALTSANILYSFQSTGIYPFDKHAIPEDRFLPSYSNDRPMPMENYPQQVADPQPSGSKQDDP